MKNTIKFSAIFTFLLAAIFTFNASVSAQNRNEILIVADQKASCRGIVAQDCLQVKHLNEEKFSLFRRNIDGFRYAPGFYYVLNVRAIERRNAPADASNLRYRLINILAQVKTDDLAQPMTESPAPPYLSSIEWKLKSVDGRIVNGDKAVIRFDEQNNRISGNGGCNGFGGDFTRNDNKLKFSRVFSTKMACFEDDAMKIENTFFRNLERVTNYQVSGNRLMLMSGNITVLEFTAKR